MPSQKITPSMRVSWTFPLGRTNVVLLACGLGTIIVGYLAMLTAISDDPAKHQNAWNNLLAVTVAPILLVVGYAILIPLGLLYRSKDRRAA
ncbi:MAG: DUF3098 domain-containing protein [Chlorobi bacterium]|nr:DUF3098 domain-containing protein [Chlorobiota bacterium]